MGLGLFAAPKPFTGHVGVIQRNAIISWTLISPSPRIVLLGDEPGTRKICTELNIDHIPLVALNRQGTPLISDIFAKAHMHLRTELMCYTNADIIFFSDLADILKSIRFDRFLLVGRRSDLDVSLPLDFTDPTWESQLRHRVATEAKLHAPTGIDFFGYPAGTLGDLPSFAVGRPGWDNYMIYGARTSRIPLIDATDSILAVHQNHDYSHVVGGLEEAWAGDEAKTNLRIAGNPAHWLDIREATWSIRDGKLSRRRLWTSRRYWTVTLPAMNPRWASCLELVRTILRRNQAD